MQPGTQLGHYRITEQIGRGGMGEVYQAIDMRLDRTVAVKVLPKHLASDPSRRERFEREARAVSSLNHPHICTLYDVGEQNGTHYLVMEKVDGEALDARLEKGRLPLDKVLEYAVQIADALDKAHRQGVVHRDLKPGNIMLSKSGVKLLDFGLAKLKGDVAPTSGLSQAPTQGDRTLTAEGTILGTLQYMAPEQLEGEEVDARTDIFALGVLLYEMVTGKRAFEGKSQASLIGAIMNSDPQPMTQLEEMTPATLDHVVRRCMAKDPDERWQAVSDVMRELRWVGETRGGGAPTVPAGRGRPGRERIVWIGVVVVLALVAGAALVRNLGTSTPAGEMRLEANTPGTTSPALAVSPDGSQLVFVASGDGVPRLWLRPLDEVSVEPLPGTEGATNPFWSQDSRWVGFFADGRLKRLYLDSRRVDVLVRAQGNFGGSSSGDVILFVPINRDPVMQISAEGDGEPQPVTPLQQQTRFPRFLPDGRHFLFGVLGGGSNEPNNVFVGDLEGDSPVPLNIDVLHAEYHPASGHLLFVSQGVLLAQPFDPNRFELSGSAIAIAGNVLDFSASDSGPIVYRTGSATVQNTTVRRNRDGDPIADLGRVLISPAISRDNEVVAFEQFVASDGDIYTMRLDSSADRRFTFDLANDNTPVISPDASRIVFSSSRLVGTSGSGTGRGISLFERPFIGAGESAVLLSIPGQNLVPVDWSPDGRFLLYRKNDPETGFDLWALPMDPPGDPIAVIQTDADERDGQFSPDGEWIVYESNEFGRFEVYVERFLEPGYKVQLSDNGGAQARWNGSEVFFVGLDGQFMVVPVQVSADPPEIRREAPRALFPVRIMNGPVQTIGRQQYVVLDNGEEFLMNVVTEDLALPITVLLNWSPGGD